MSRCIWASGVKSTFPAWDASIIACTTFTLTVGSFEDGRDWGITDLKAGGGGGLESYEADALCYWTALYWM